MEVWYTKIGIVLQSVAGLLFILRSILSEEVKKKINDKLQYLLEAVSGSARRRWQIAFIAGPLAVVALTALIFIYDTNNQAMTLDKVGGAVMFVAIGSGIYMLSLQQLLKLTGRWKLVGGEASRARKMFFSNVILLASSIFLLAISVALFNVPAAGESLAWTIYRGVWTFVIGVSIICALPCFVASAAFLLVLGVVRLLNVVRDIRPTVFWLLLLVLWIVGSVFLLVG